jgi:cleavage and polyadenylation specificity factor subunit 3
MNDKIRRQIAINNPFIFKHISSLKVRHDILNIPLKKCLFTERNVFAISQGIDQFEDVGPCVIMASPGMMQSGLSRELFEAWCTDPKNGCIIAGGLPGNNESMFSLFIVFLFFFCPQRVLC